MFMTVAVRFPLCPVDGKGNERPPPGLGRPFDILLCHPWRWRRISESRRDSQFKQPRMGITICSEQAFREPLYYQWVTSQLLE